jgi:MOSC domain-containing protein YiiM
VDTVELVSIQIASSLPLMVGGRQIRTGIFKEPVPTTTIAELGLVGDAVVNTKHHGGPDQAVYVYSLEDYAWWSERLDIEVIPGLFGENLTFSSFGSEVMIGDRWRLGEVILEATAPRLPCATFGAKMGDGAFPKRFREARRPGFYARVIQGGDVAPGLAIERSSSSHEVSVVDLFDLAYNTRASAGVLRKVLAAPIAERARDDYERRLRKAEGR